MTGKEKRFSSAANVFLSWKNGDGGDPLNSRWIIPIKAIIKIKITAPLASVGHVKDCFILYIKKHNGKMLNQTNLCKLIAGVGLQLIDKPIQI